MSAPDLAEIAHRHGVSAAAVDSVMRSLRASGGTSAQFNHPDLGGSGQWMPGMTQIGDMFNSALRARVDALCSDLAGHLGTTPSGEPPAASPDRWWPASLGSPDAAGGQDDVRYAWFARSRRLAVDQGGAVTLYDTGPHQITGVSQSQHTGGRSVVFSTSAGPLDLASLPAAVE